MYIDHPAQAGWSFLFGERIKTEGTIVEEVG